MAAQKGVEYREVSDEIITDVAKGIELFVAENEFFDKFCNHVSVPRGHKTFSYRRLIAPRVAKDEVKTSAEYVAPRPIKFVVETFEKTVEIYRDKFVYSKEDLMYHFDDTVNSGRTTLQEIVRQKKDWIKGTPFLNSACIITPEQVSSADAMIPTLKKAAIILRKNKAARWDGKHYLCILTPELKQKLLAEIEDKGVSLAEPVKMKLAGVEMSFDVYGDWMFAETIHEMMYKTDAKQYMILMGKRAYDGSSPVTVSQMAGESGLEVINRPLGSGVLVDEDGNYTADDNNQRGAIAINVNGLGAAVNDDLCILDCEFTINEIKGSNLLESEKTGFVSASGNEVEITATPGTKTSFEYVGARVDSSTSKAYALRSTILKVTTVADEGEAFTSIATTDWAVKYRNKASGTQYDAKILGFLKDSVDNDTILVEVPSNCYDFAVTCTAVAD